MFPDILILILLDVVIVYATFRTTRKGVRIWKKETATKKEAANGGSNDVEMQRSPDSVKAVASSSNVAGSDTVHEGGDQPASGRVDSGISSDGLSDGVTNGASDGMTSSNMSPSQSSKHSHVPTISNQMDLDNLSDAALSDVGSPHSTDGLKDHGHGTRSGTGTISKDAIRRRLSEGCGVTMTEMTDDTMPYAQAFIAKESELMKPIGIICIVWLAVVSFAILKKEEITGVGVCSGWYWLFTFLPIPIMAAVSYYMTRVEYDFYQLKIEKQCWVPAEGDIKLEGSFARILKFPAIASIAGVLAGLLGIGGGMVVSPLFIELGVLPMVAAATSGI